MKKKDNSKIKSIIKLIFLAMGVFTFSVLVSIITRMVLLKEVKMFGFSEGQAALIASMLEGIVGALSAGIVVYQLKSGNVVEERQNDIEEAKFIIEYNQSFIQDEKMCAIEQQLEQEMLRLEKGEKYNVSIITDNNRQQYINYLVYLEGVAPLVLRGVLRLEHIDDLMAYRFFLAINSPSVQEDQLKVFPDYYRGCFKLYKLWKEYRMKNGREIINEEYSIDKWEYFMEFSENIAVRKLLPSDNLNSVAELIYKTDRFIYPTAFGKEIKAINYIANLLQIKNNPFHKDNIRVAVINDEIVGFIVILTKRPTTEYNFEDFYTTNSHLPKSYMHTATNYFNDLFDYVDDKNTYIPCLCVKKNYWHKHIGQTLLIHAIRENHYKDLNLHVLKENKNAIKLYEKCGFKTVTTCNGYSIKKEKPTCIKMTYFIN